MDGPSTYCKSLLALILRILRHALTQKHHSCSPQTCPACMLLVMEYMCT